MDEERRRRKTKRKQRQTVILKQKRTESKNFSQLLEELEGLEKEGKYVDVQICPRCKSSRVRKVGTMNGDVSGHMGLLPAKFECLECG